MEKKKNIEVTGGDETMTDRYSEIDETSTYL